MNKRIRKLQLDRERVRVLTPMQLGRAAGGDLGTTSINDTTGPMPSRTRCNMACSGSNDMHCY